MRSALADIVDSEDGLELVGVARDAEEAVWLAVESCPDVAPVDVKMPGGGGVRAARDITLSAPYAPPLNRPVRPPGLTHLKRRPPPSDASLGERLSTGRSRGRMWGYGSY